MRSFKPGISAVDLFCGAGGLTKGLEISGIKVKLGVDVDAACEFPYSHNNSGEFLKSSVTDIRGANLKPYFNKRDIQVLAGCAPCQTFSSYNQKAKQNDERWGLLLEFARITKELRPQIVTMENVPGLARQKIFSDFVNALELQGYNVNYSVVDCSNYGLPQKRKRLVLLASTLGEIALISPAQFTRKPTQTVRDVIGSLPPLTAGSCDKSDPLHKCASLSALNLKRIRASKPGGSWRQWPKGLIADCHRKAAGENYGSVYGRMKWELPSPSMTTQFFGFGSGRFGHPEQDRAISLREGALLQGFPKSYQFNPPGKTPDLRTIARLIGNAVPVRLGEVIGKSIVRHTEMCHDQRKNI